MCVCRSIKVGNCYFLGFCITTRVSLFGFPCINVVACQGKKKSAANVVVAFQLDYKDILLDGEGSEG